MRRDKTTARPWTTDPAGKPVDWLAPEYHRGGGVMVLRLPGENPEQPLTVRLQRASEYIRLIRRKDRREKVARAKHDLHQF